MGIKTVNISIVDLHNSFEKNKIEGIRDEAG